jgi:hypothetical protein
MCSPLRDGGELPTLENYARAFLKYMKELPAGHRAASSSSAKG